MPDRHFSDATRVASRETNVLRDVTRVYALLLNAMPDVYAQDTRSFRDATQVVRIDEQSLPDLTVVSHVPPDGRPLMPRYRLGP